MGHIGPARQRYEVLLLPDLVLSESDRHLLERAGDGPPDLMPPDPTAAEASAPPPVGVHPAL